MDVLAVKHLPLSETEQSQLDKKEEMKMFKKNYSTDVVNELVKCTYYTQRKDINKGANIQKLCQEWPFLFNEVGMPAHLQELTLFSSFRLKAVSPVVAPKKSLRCCFFYWLILMRRKSFCSTVLKRQALQRMYRWCHPQPSLLFVVPPASLLRHSC
ncbi:hypothetical protein HF521_009612 [Silurus meridionalis]|uniref:Uncharacterized protein n=1 Tax=Silurus meridionalis TaxID=175797 RepID=A0A8T0BYU7_SILME|nr:hypothetical protein HF521_009612 [Silurus meridionalis]